MHVHVLVFVLGWNEWNEETSDSNSVVSFEIPFLYFG